MAGHVENNTYLPTPQNLQPDQSRTFWGGGNLQVLGKLPADPLQVLFPPPPRPPPEGVTRPSYVHDLRNPYGGMSMWGYCGG